MILEVRNLSHAYAGNYVLRDVSFSLAAGERLAVLGPSGSGKTTLVRLIAGLDAPTDGEVALSGRPASRPGRVLLAPENRQVAVVFQGLALFPHLRALDQITFAARGPDRIAKSRHLLDRVGLLDRASARLDQLSGGERQRIALARALAQEPRLILMDEPFASLDDEKRAEMRDLLRGLLEKTQTTLILITHNRDDALDLAQRVLVLERGLPVAHDALHNVLSRPPHSAAARSLGLGTVVEGHLTPNGVETAFGILQTANGHPPGRAHLLIRPGQPRLASNGDGVEAEVVSIELRPTETRAVDRWAVVRIAGKLLRVFVEDRELTAGQSVRVVISGESEVLDQMPSSSAKSSATLASSPVS